MTAHSPRSATAGIDTREGSNARQRTTPAVAPTAAPVTSQTVEQQGAEDPARSSAPTPAQQYARAAAAEVAYPREKYGAKTGVVWGSQRFAVIVGGDEPVDMSWSDGTGLCAGMNPDVFFPARGDATKAANEAKAVCLSGCPLLEPCREHGIKHERLFGVWGGLSVLERKEIRRQRALEGL